jgi:putative transposase
MEPGNFYHVYNHANGRENLFVEPKNYDFFLQQVTKHILPVSRIFAYSLMPNHFHLLVQLKAEKELIAQFEEEFSSMEKTLANEAGVFSLQNFLIKKSNKSYSNLFNSYTQSFNKVYDRKGSLFMQNMKKQEITDDNSFCKVVHYIHKNPVHHGFVKALDIWPHTSYKIILSNLPTKLERQYVLDVFGGIEQFIKYHDQAIDPDPKFKFSE